MLALFPMGAPWRREAGVSETANRDAVELAGRISRGDSDDDGAVPLARDLVPDRQRIDRSAVDDAEPFVGMIDSVSEPVDSKRTRVLAARARVASPGDSPVASESACRRGHAVARRRKMACSGSSAVSADWIGVPLGP